MQLKKFGKRRVSRALGAVTANLFIATHAYAQAAQPPAPAPPLPIPALNVGGNASGSVIDDTSSDLSTTVLDTSVLFYQELGGRVHAVEPVARLKITGYTGDSLSIKATYDSLTGASPNGAAPWSDVQTFTVPIATPGQEEAVTGASGNTQVVTIPGTGTQVGQYTVPAHQLPLDQGFRDRRFAGDVGYTRVFSSNTRASFGFSGSDERDYLSLSGNASFAQDFADHTTTLTVGVNYEYDKSNPHFGTPTPFTEMNGLVKGPGDSKSVLSLVAGFTHVMTRFWLLQVNYDIGWNKGYQTDPYKIISVVDPITGAPQQYLYENRPRSRTRQSLYTASKLAIGPTVADLSFRYYWDSWSIKSITAEVSERVPITSWFYVEPEFRYYHQTAAKFFNYYLLAGQPLPAYASADGRLNRFNARTIGVRLGFPIGDGEFYILGQDYKQTGTKTVPTAPGDLAFENLFSGVHARSVMAGFSFTFR